MNLDFLKDVKIEAVESAAPKSRVSTPSLPTTGDIRVFANGKVFPSEEFAKKFDLEFQPRTTEDGKDVVHGNGLDVFPSTEWTMIKEKMPMELIFCAVVPKAYPKVDLWSSTKYDAETGEPKASIFTQGSNVFSKSKLVPMIAEIYGVNWDEVEYVDLKIVEDSPIVSPTGYYYLPKVVMSGVHKGKPDYIRRENLNVVPLVIESQAEAKPAAAKVEEVIKDVKPEADVVEEKIAEIESNDAIPAETTDAEMADAGDDWAAQLGAK